MPALNTSPEPSRRRSPIAGWVAWLIFTGWVLSVPVVAYGVWGAAATMNNEFRQWAPAAMETTRHYDEFVRDFDSDEAVLVSWEGCTLDDQRLDLLARQLPMDEPTGDGSSRSAFQLLVTGRQLLEELTSGPMALTRAEACRRLEGFLVGPDGNNSGALVILSPVGASNRPAAVARLVATLAECGVPSDDVHLGGPAADQVALEQESRRTLYHLTALAAAVSAALTWLCLRSARLALAVFVIAAYGAGLTVALVYFTGGAVTLVMTAMPVLVFVLGISTAVHLVNYYWDARRTEGEAAAPCGSLRRGWQPCLVSAVTTCLGMGSLATSRIAPIRAFGIFSAIGVLLTVALVLAALPAVLRLLPPRDKSSLQGRARLGFFSRFMLRLPGGVMRHHQIASLVSLVVMIVGVIGITRMQTSVKLQDQFKPGSRIMTDYRWLESRLGPVVPLEIVVGFEPDSPLRLLDRVALVRRVESAVRGPGDIEAALSAATFVPPVPIGSDLRSTARRGVIQKSLAEQLPRFEQMQLIREDFHGRQRWRITVRLSAFGRADYGEIIHRLKQRVDPVLPSGKEPYEIDVTYTGVIPLIDAASSVLLADLFRSFALAFVVVAAVIAVALRSVRAAAVAMIPNLFPAVIVLGILSWAGRAIDIGAMMTASVALGIAVDDTVHFLTWVRRGVLAGKSIRRAVRLAYRRCAVAMTQTTLICGLGLLPFALSDYVPSRMFALLIAAMLAAALVGDLVQLPALILGPLGRQLIPRNLSPARRDTQRAAATHLP